VLLVLVAEALPIRALMSWKEECLTAVKVLYRQFLVSLHITLAAVVELEKTDTLTLVVQVVLVAPVTVAPRTQEQAVTVQLTPVEEEAAPLLPLLLQGQAAVASLLLDSP
jgi:hypothetical protein